MKSNATYVSYEQTGKFTSLICDYLNKKPDVAPFFNHFPDVEGVQKTIRERQQFPTDRNLIANVFDASYLNAGATESQLKHIQLLRNENCFTVCTAHQPNIFTGYLYFIYKTAHTIVLCNTLKAALPEFDFVPVFYIGSEDNDLDELSRFRMHGKLYKWHTDQTGAVGRMHVDPQLSELIKQIESELAHLPHASELIDLLKRAYAPNTDLAHGIFSLLNSLFGEQGLLVLQPDHADLKSVMTSVFKDDLLQHIPQSVVSETNEALGKQYGLQVNPRQVNLFYLRDGIRNRIDRRGNTFSVDGTVIRFSESEILEELNSHPERFSPNVILRGLYQETILPNIAFVGGGSEVAYWMQLKALFSHYKVPYPLLVLRNSFMIMNSKQEHKLNELDIDPADLFKDETALANEMVVKWAGANITLEKEMHMGRQYFAHLREQAGAVDKSLQQHVHALEVDLLKKIETLEKKMLKAERKKQAIQLQRIWKLKSELFPNNNLQERVDNFMPYFAEYGQAFIDVILKHSRSLEQEFGVIVVG